MRQKAVSHCWQCTKQLMRIKGGFTFSLIRDPDGNLIRVHKVCVKDAVGHGYTEVKESK